MTQPPPFRPLYLGTLPDPILAFFHPAAATPVATAVLLCSPWGWDDVASYRARFTWAEELAAAGYPTLRFDFPGTGDSGGSADDPQRVEASTAAVAGAAAWLRAETGSTRVAAIGLGLGGLLAAQAIADGAEIDDLVLWGTPDRGQSYVRQERAFSQMQTSRYSLEGEPEPVVLPRGWMEAGGFVMSAETIAALSKINLATLVTGRLGRALLFDRDGIPSEPRVREHMVEAGVDVTEGDGAGWGAMCFHPEQYKVPLEVIAQVISWLASAPADTVPSNGVRPAALESIELAVNGALARETAVMLQLPVGRRFAVLTEPADVPMTGVSGIFLNAGAVRRIGPNRMWVETARRWATRGVPTLRVDLSAIGDSDGDGTKYRDVGAFFAPELEEEIVALINEMVRRGMGERVVLGGLCAGGFWSFHGAARDARVRAALMMNPRLLVWDPHVISRRVASQVTRLRDAAAWRQILRGEVTLAQMRAFVGAILAHGRRWLTRLPSAVRAMRGHRPRDPVEELLGRLRDKQTRVLIGFSGDEPLHDELERDGYLARLHEWPNVEVQTLPGRDHTFRPIVAQRAVQARLDRELTRVLEGVPASHRDSQEPDP